LVILDILQIGDEMKHKLLILLIKICSLIFLFIIAIKLLFIVIALLFLSSDYGEKQFQPTNKIFNENRVLFDSVVSKLQQDTALESIRKNNVFFQSSVYLFKYKNEKRFEFDIKQGILLFNYILKKHKIDLIYTNNMNAEIEILFKILKILDLYCISNSPTSLTTIRFMLTETTSIIFIEDKSKFRPEKRKGTVFKHIDGNYYYYFTPT
jgi:hypothetical protein